MGLYIVIGIWIAMIIGTIVVPDQGDEKPDNIVSAIFGGGVFCAIFTFVFWMASVCPPVNQDTIVEHKTYCNDIVSIKGGSGIHGSFFLGCGTIGSDRYYVYYEKQSNGSYKQKRISVDDAAIIEEENCKPRIHWEGMRYLCTSWFMPKRFASTSGEFETEKLIYVPKGTIIQTFKLD